MSNWRQGGERMGDGVIWLWVGSYDMLIYEGNLKAKGEHGGRGLGCWGFCIVSIESDDEVQLLKASLYPDSYQPPKARLWLWLHPTPKKLQMELFTRVS